MGYIQTLEHFFNYLNKTARENPEVNVNEFMPVEFYVNEIYDAGLADAYTWALRKQGAHLLEEEPLLRWLAQQRKTFFREDTFTHIFSEAFVELSDDLAQLCGVYSFWRPDGGVLYVGRSIRLGERILTSFRDHFHHYDRAVYARYIHTNSAPDAAILELYFITTLNPPLNRQDNYATQELTLTITPIPEWSGPVRCNVVAREE